MKLTAADREIAYSSTRASKLSRSLRPLRGDVSHAAVTMRSTCQRKEKKSIKDLCKEVNLWGCTYWDSWRELLGKGERKTCLR